jgi:hypothetical protein
MKILLISVIIQVILIASFIGTGIWMQATDTATVLGQDYEFFYFIGLITVFIMMMIMVSVALMESNKE